MKSQLFWPTPLHELSICQAVLGQVLAVAAARKAEHIERITLRIGPLAGVEPELVRLAFPIVAAGTPCENATLDIWPAPVQVSCRICGATSQVAPNRVLCGQCATWCVDMISGDELLLVRIELLGADAVDIDGVGMDAETG